MLYTYHTVAGKALLEQVQRDGGGVMASANPRRCSGPFFSWHFARRRTSGRNFVGKETCGVTEAGWCALWQRAREDEGKKTARISGASGATAASAETTRTDTRNFGSPLRRRIENSRITLRVWCLVQAMLAFGRGQFFVWIFFSAGTPISCHPRLSSAFSCSFEGAS